jgi:hypothetical protein
VLLTTIGGIKDNNGNMLTPRESIAKITAMKNLIVLIMEDANMFGGIVGGYVTSGEAQGSAAAKLVLQYFQENSLLHVEDVTQSPNIYLFNAIALRDARIILSEYVKRDALIIDEQKDFFEENKMLILDLFAIIVIIFLFILIILYTIQRKKYIASQEDVLKLQRLREKLFAQEELLKNCFKLGRIGYWKYDLETKKVHVSDELLTFLDVDLSIYADDPEVIYYFIHPADRVMFDTKFDEIRALNESVIIHHKMITTHKKVYKVRHLLYKETKSLDSDGVIVGIIEFDEE